MAENTAPEHHDVTIIGAGAAGLYMLHTCRGLGLDAVVLERGNGVGGTWYWNRYPGARCDVESLDYSYSFDDELQKEWRWAEKYATQPEILSYLEHVADRFDLRKDVNLDSTVVSATFDEHTDMWTVRTEDGREFTATYVIAATGVLSEPKVPAFPGQEDFAGTLLISNQWPTEGFDFTGKRVAVIGAGSTGIQVSPLIAQDASKLYVLQRTPSYSIPAYNRYLSDEEFDRAVSEYPERRQRARSTLLGVDTKNPDTSTFEVSEEEVQAAYQANFDYGGPMKLLTTFNDPVVDKEANDVVAAFLAEKIRERVGHTDLAEHLIPDYPVGSRRLCVDTDYYETLTRDNVELVDLRDSPIRTFTRSGISTEHRDIEVDVIVLATGFDAITGPLRAIDPQGRHGISLRRKWGDYPASYLGVMVAGFPNLFTITGPLSPSVNSNMFVAIEQHVEFIAQLLRHSIDRDHAVIEATPQAEDQWIAHSAEIAAATVFPLTNSWYTGANISGKASAVMPYLGGIGGYQAVIDEIARDDFRGFKVTENASATV